MSKTIWEMSDEEIEFGKRQAQTNVKNGLIAGGVLFAIWAVAVGFAASSVL
jgi:hypothetical protein